MSENTTMTKYPLHKGWYECKVDGETCVLYMNICTLKNSHQWLLPDRTPVDEDVEWIREVERPIF